MEDRKSIGNQITPTTSMLVNQCIQSNYLQEHVCLKGNCITESHSTKQVRTY